MRPAVPPRKQKVKPLPAPVVIRSGFVRLSPHFVIFDAALHPELQEDRDRFEKVWAEKHAGCCEAGDHEDGGDEEGVRMEP